MDLISKRRKLLLYAQNSPKDSIGQFLGTLPARRFGRLHCWDAIGDARREFTELRIKILHYLEQNNDKVQDSGYIIDLSLFMLGRSPVQAKPTVMFVSENKKARKEAFDMIKDSNILEDYPGFELGHLPLTAEFENLRLLAGRDVSFVCDASSIEEPLDVFSPRKSKLVGQRLYFYSTSDSEETPQMATAGGVITYQGRRMLLTVDHFLETSQTIATPPFIPGLDEDKDSNDECEITGLSEFDDEDEDRLAEITSQGSITPEFKGPDFSGYESNNDRTSILLSESRINVQTNIVTLHERLERLEENQASILPNGPSNEHCIRVGKVILRSKELDYSLVEIDPDLMNLDEIRTNTIDLKDVSQIERDCRDAAVKTTTPDGGIVGGKLSGTPSYVRLPHSKTFVEVYIARFNRPLVPGDCGSWVRDAITGCLFGHIFAGSPTSGLTMIMPACHVFEGARYSLESQRGSETRSSRDVPCARRPLTVAELVDRIDKHIDGILVENPRLKKEFQQPESSTDRLYHSSKVQSPDDQSRCAKACGDDLSTLVVGQEIIGNTRLMYIINPNGVSILALRRTPASQVDGFRKLFANYLNPSPVPELSLRESDEWNLSFVLECNLPYLAITTQDRSDTRTLSQNRNLRARDDIEFLNLKYSTTTQCQQQSSCVPDNAVLHVAVFSLMITGRSEQHSTTVCLDDQFFDQGPRLMSDEEIVSLAGREDPITLQPEVKRARSPRAYSLVALDRQLERIVEYHANAQECLKKSIDIYTAIPEDICSERIVRQKMDEWRKRFPIILNNLVHFNQRLAEKVSRFLTDDVMVGSDEVPYGALWQGLQAELGTIKSLRAIKRYCSQLRDIGIRLEHLRDAFEDVRRKRKYDDAVEQQTRDRTIEQVTVAAFGLAIMNLIAQVYTGKPGKDDASAWPAYIAMVVTFNVICISGLSWFVYRYRSRRATAV